MVLSALVDSLWKELNFGETSAARREVRHQQEGHSEEDMSGRPSKWKKANRKEEWDTRQLSADPELFKGWSPKGAWSGF